MINCVNIHYRSPFELSTPYSVFAALLQIGCCVSASLIYYAMICSFIETVVYAKTFVMDIRSTFARLDEAAKTRSSEFSMLNSCKEAVDLHARVYQYVLLTSFFLRPLMNESYFPRCMHRFANATHLIIMVTVSPFCLLICSSLLIIDKVNNTIRQNKRIIQFSNFSFRRHCHFWISKCQSLRYLSACN